MEGTSGAADRGPLRGGSREAALQGQRRGDTGQVGRVRQRVVFRSTRRCRSPAGAPRARDMRCPSRSGWGEALAASDRGGRSRASRANALSRPLARDVSVGCASRTATRTPSAAVRERHEKQLCSWATVSMVRGVRTIRRLCSRIEVGCRSRQATFGPSCLPGDEPRRTASGLAIPGESIGSAKARRKPGPRRQSRDTGGGLPPIGLRESGPREHLSVEGALGRGSRTL
jgi:hypothetical protein